MIAFDEQWAPPASEAEARTELAVAYRAADLFGWTDLGATHFSCRVPGTPEHFLMLPLGAFFDEVTAENLLVIDLDGRIVDGPAGALANPAGVTIHAGMYRHAPRIEAIMHTHTRAGVASSCHPEGLLPLSQHALRFHGRTGRHRYEGVVSAEEEGARLVADLGDAELLLLENHGLLTVGASVPEAFSALYYAEFSAQVQVDTLATTTVPVLPCAEVCAHTAAQYEASTGYQFRDWMGIVRLVARRSTA